MLSQLRQLILAFFLMTLSLFIGIIGFMMIEGYNLSEAFYMSVITISTVGFAEVHPLSENGKLFTSFYIITNFNI